LWGSTLSGISWASFSSKSSARIETSQSWSRASSASSEIRAGDFCTSVCARADCATDRRSPPVSNERNDRSCRLSPVARRCTFFICSLRPCFRASTGRAPVRPL
jgi:hypothetical protein